MKVDSIQKLNQTLPASVPPVEGYDAHSDGWHEAEHRVVLPVESVIAGYWEGAPGWVDFESWPYNELCVILAGKVAVEDHAGGRAEYGAGESFVIPKGFAGRWLTVEPTKKIFVGIDVDPA